MPHVLIFANPTAGRGNARKQAAQDLRDRLASLGRQAIIITDPPSSADPDLLNAADAAVSMGGDGTLRAVAQRFLDVRGQVPPLLPFPMGTANLMCRCLGIAWPKDQAIDRAAQAVVAGKIRLLDAGLANGRVFLLMVGIGIDAFIVHELARVRRGAISVLSYTMPAIRALMNYAYEPVTVRVDGETISQGRPAAVFVANAVEYALQFPMVPDAKPDDGVLNVCVVPVTGRLHALSQFLRAATGDHVHEEGVVRASGQFIEIESQVPIPVQADGDPAGQTPVRIDLLPTKMPFIVPA